MRDFDWMILATLYKTKNITKTANRLFITQPSLTRRLQQIETELGTTLLIRNNKGVTFTSHGEYVAGKAVTLLDIIDDVKLHISQSNNKLSGTLRIGAPNSYMHFIMPSLIGKFTQTYPDINLDLHTDLSSELLKSLEAKELDAGFLRGDVSSSLDKRLLSEDQIYIISKEPIILSDLPDLPQIEYTKEKTIVKATRRWWKERYKTPPNIRFRVHSGDACIQLVKNNLGYGIFSDGKYADPDDDLFSLPLEYLDGSKFTRKSWLVYDKEDLCNPLLSHFIDFLKEIQF